MPLQVHVQGEPEPPETALAHQRPYTARINSRSKDLMDSLTKHLTAYASGLTYSDLPPEVVDKTKRIILDSVGCALGAARGGLIFVAP